MFLLVSYMIRLTLGKSDMNDYWTETKASWAQLVASLRELGSVIKERIGIELLILGLRLLGEKDIE
jgi:hypothetical protein